MENQRCIKMAIANVPLCGHSLVGAAYRYSACRHIIELPVMLNRDLVRKKLKQGGGFKITAAYLHCIFAWFYCIRNCSKKQGGAHLLTLSPRELQQNQMTPVCALYLFNIILVRS